MSDFVDLLMRVNHIGLMFVIGMIMGGAKKALSGTKLWKFGADILPALLGALGALVPGIVQGDSLGGRIMLGVVLGACSSWTYGTVRRMIQARGGDAEA